MGRRIPTGTIGPVEGAQAGFRLASGYAELRTTACCLRSSQAEQVRRASLDNSLDAKPTELCPFIEEGRPT